MEEFSEAERTYATCPTCSLPPEHGKVNTDREGFTAIIYLCPLGHSWVIQWQVTCEVCRRPVAQDFDPCDREDGPRDRCEPCDDAVCSAYEAGVRHGMTLREAR